MAEQGVAACVALEEGNPHPIWSARAWVGGRVPELQLDKVGDFPYIRLLFVNTDVT